VKLVYTILLDSYMRLLSLRDGRLIIFKTVSDTCPSCGKRMEGKRSRKRPVTTLLYGAALIAEEYFVCPRCKDGETGRRVIHHSEPLRGILPLNSKYGYDVEIEAGYLQYVENKQIDEINNIFNNAYGISVPQSQIHELGIRFLMHMVANHYLSAPLLGELFKKTGCVFHIDATCEAGRGMELSIKEGWTGIVLGVWKIPTENEEIIKQHLRSTVELFGEPVAFVSDLGNGMMSAITGLIKEMHLNSRQLVCHMHFLKAVGGSILEDMYKTLKSQFKKLKTLADLNRFVKEAGAIIKPCAADMRRFVTRWQESGAQLDIPGYMETVAVLRALAQWVILFNSECGGESFPFAMSYITLFERCTTALCTLTSLHKKGCVHKRADRYAERLRRILYSPFGDPGICNNVKDLKVMRTVFTELRKLMRLEKTDIFKQDKNKKTPDDPNVVAKLAEDVSCFRTALRTGLDTGAVSGAGACASRVVLDYFDKYERYLFGHFFTSHDESGETVVRLIDRSNNVMERSYNNQKHQIRRRTGLKNLGFIFEHIFPAAYMAVNLDNPIYQQTVLCNKTRGNLAGIFSSLDDKMTYYDTPMYQDEFEVVGGRLPKADRKIVGKPDFSKVISMMAVDYCNSLKLQQA